eukprot:TRINITY_DN4471_c0_g1_i1.p1 TRINITY_DN4471_c0_g1~~TRINITY_DN4471_c0_g1_i1.p1  ORF type:complete len:348 (+),score=18.49 TRINITY_DN4471_c0_g1_i1:124-1044(+)
MICCCGVGLGVLLWGVYVLWSVLLLVICREGYVGFVIGFGVAVGGCLGYGVGSSLGDGGRGVRVAAGVVVGTASALLLPRWIEELSLGLIYLAHPLYTLLESVWFIGLTLESTSSLLSHIEHHEDHESLVYSSLLAISTAFYGLTVYFTYSLFALPGVSHWVSSYVGVLVVSMVVVFVCGSLSPVGVISHSASLCVYSSLAASLAVKEFVLDGEPLSLWSLDYLLVCMLGVLCIGNLLVLLWRENDVKPDLLIHFACSYCLLSLSGHLSDSSKLVGKTYFWRGVQSLGVLYWYLLWLYRKHRESLF